MKFTTHLLIGAILFVFGGIVVYSIIFPNRAIAMRDRLLGKANDIKQGVVGAYNDAEAAVKNVCHSK